MGEHVGGAVVAEVVSVEGVEELVPVLGAVPILEALARSEHDLDVRQPEVDLAVLGVVEDLSDEHAVGKVQVALDQLRQTGEVAVVAEPQRLVDPWRTAKKM